MRPALRIVNGGYQPTAADIAHERRMQEVLELVDIAPSVSTKRRLWNRYKALHAQRSPEMVRYLEIQRGLR